MRILKFRAWNTSKEVMHSAYELGQDQVALLPDGKGFANISGISTRLSEIYSHLLPLQFTGLHDKNGKEIYEGDIVKATGQRYDYLQVIEFHNTGESCGRGWIGRNLKQLASPLWKTPEEDISGRFSYFCWPATWEVIGNIYENPDLLKKKGVK